MNKVCEIYGTCDRCLIRPECYAMDMYINNLDFEGIQRLLLDLYKRSREETIDDILKLHRLNHYDNYNELMYQSIKVSVIEKLKKPKEDDGEEL